MSETRTATVEHSRLQRPLALLIMLVAGALSLPTTAYFFDGDGDENWIAPITLAAVVAVGAVVGALLPGVAGAHATRTRGMWVGALISVGLLIVAVVVFFVLLSGFEGA